MGELSEERDVMDRIVEFYLRSGDFSGLPVSSTQNTSVATTAGRLVAKGLVEVVTGADYLNPHIRPWPTQRTIAEQMADLQDAATAPNSLCLYPTSAGLEGRLSATDFQGRPYHRRLAEGGTTLQAIYFRLDVLESYREDPRFDLQFEDFGFTFNISSESYEDENEPDAEKVSLLHGGYGFNQDHETIERVAVVLLCDLKGFTPEIQQRWRTFEMPDQTAFMPHPVWWAGQMGHWPDGPGPFTRFFGEREALNDIFAAAFGRRLFRTTSRPKEFGWLLRPSRREYQRFAHDLDKLLSDDIDQKALSAAMAPKTDSEGKPMGSLNRLEAILERGNVPEAQRSAVLAPLRRVRTERMGPAHKIESNRRDPALVKVQIELLGDVVEALTALRHFFQRHPKARDVQIAGHLDCEHSYRM